MKKIMIIPISLWLVSCQPDQPAQTSRHISKPSKSNPSLSEHNKNISDQECLICGGLVVFQSIIPASDFAPPTKSALQAKLEALKKTPRLNYKMIVSFKKKGFCERPDIKSLRSLAETRMKAYDTLIGKISACSEACSISVNAAEYCTFGSRMEMEADIWATLSDNFTQAAITLDLANQHDGSVIAELSRNMDGATREALDVLREDFSALALKGEAHLNDPRLHTSTKDFHDISASLEAYHWAGLMPDNARALAAHINMNAKQLNSLHADINQALHRAAVLQPEDRQILAQQTLKLAANIEFVRRSLEKSVEEDTKSSNNITPNTTANAALKRKITGADFKKLDDCFTRLSFETHLVPSVTPLVHDEVGKCRSFQYCPSRAFSPPTGLKAKVDLLLESRLEDEKILSAVTRSICK